MKLSLSHKLSAATLGVATTLLVLASAAGAQTDPVADKISDTTDQFTAYGPLVLAGVVAVVGVFIAIPLVKKFARMIRNAIG